MQLVGGTRLEMMMSKDGLLGRDMKGGEAPDENYYKHVGMSKSEADALLSPGFQLAQVKNHVQILTKLGSEMIQVDEKLSPLLERINRFKSTPITTMSCQHDWFGWASIDFGYQDFEWFLQVIRLAHLKKYGRIRTKDDNAIIGFYGLLIDSEFFGQRSRTNPSRHSSASSVSTVAQKWWILK
jgi:hypothetical protein